MEKWIKILAVFLIVTIVFSCITYYFNFEFYQFLVQEDGLIENITAITLLICAILLLVRLFRVGRSKNTKWLVFNIALVVVLILGFGEEISWGQRIFAIESNDFFLRNNMQEETNLHNLKVYDVSLNRVLFAFIIPLVLGLYFLLSLYLYKSSKFARNFGDEYGIQIPKIKHTILLLVVSGLVFTVSDPDKWELWEGLFPLIFLLVFLEPYNSKEKLIP